MTKEAPYVAANSHKKVYLRVLLGIFSLLLCCQSGLGQVHRPKPSEIEAAGKYSVSELPVVDLSQINSLRAQEPSSIEAIRARSPNFIGTGSHPLYDPSSGRTLVAERFVHSLDNNPLPIASAEIIVVGTVTSVSSHISADGNILYSTFAFTPTRFLKGLSGLPPSSITLERVGDLALYPDGAKNLYRSSWDRYPQCKPSIFDIS